MVAGETDGTDGPARNYLLGRSRRMIRHVQAHGSRALVGGVSTSGVLAGFLSASNRIWPLWAYIGIAAAATVVILLVLALRSTPRFGLPVLAMPAIGSIPAAARLSHGLAGTGSPGDPSSTPSSPGSSKPARRPATSRPSRLLGPDVVYSSGMRVLLGPSNPLIVIPSNRRDVGTPHELPLPLFTAHGPHTLRSRVTVHPREFGIPLAPYSFERELPDGVHDTEHTLAVKDLVYLPELAAELRAAGGRPSGQHGQHGQHGQQEQPIMLPEHCVDPLLLAERDVVVVGGPDTNFWHGALFEPVWREFSTPVSPIPLALTLRSPGSDTALYGSRAISARMTDLGHALRHTRDEHTELDERLYPTYGMALACRNPFAAAMGRSHWVVFLAGTRSLGSSGAVLGLTQMLRSMRTDPGASYFSRVPSSTRGLDGEVSAVLMRTRTVEQSVLRRDGSLTARTRRVLPPEGNDRAYSDSYVPVTVEHLDFTGDEPEWAQLPC